MTDPVTSSTQPDDGAPAPAVQPVAPAAGVPQPVAAVPQPASAPAPLATPPARGSGRATNLLLGVALVVAVGGLAFAGGRLTAPASAGGLPIGRDGLVAGSFDPNQAGGFGQGGPGGARAVTITGTVKSLDGSTLVLATADGAEMTIDVSGSTYHAETVASASDLTSGTSVSVTVDGLGGLRGPNASSDPNSGGDARPITASDVIITGE